MKIPFSPKKLFKEWDNMTMTCQKVFYFYFFYSELTRSDFFDTALTSLNLFQIKLSELILSDINWYLLFELQVFPTHFLKKKTILCDLAPKVPIKNIFLTIVKSPHILLVCFVFVSFDGLLTRLLWHTVDLKGIQGCKVALIFDLAND